MFRSDEPRQNDSTLFLVSIYFILITYLVTREGAKETFDYMICFNYSYGEPNNVSRIKSYDTLEGFYLEQLLKGFFSILSKLQFISLG